MTNAITRILTAAVALPVVLGAVWLGGAWFGIAITAVGLLALREFYDLERAAGLKPFDGFGLGMGLLLMSRWLDPIWMPAAAGLIACALVAFIPFSSRESPAADLAGTLAGVIYPVSMLSVLIELRDASFGSVTETEAAWRVVSVLVLIWSSDTVAYVVGRSIGRRPLLPKVSPKKTWEGFFGGLAGAAGAAFVLGNFVLTEVSWPAWIALTLVAGVVAPLGDLAESRMKRSVGVKDSGSILPGHGGLLDRIDALLVAAPTMALVFLLEYSLR